MSSKIRFGIIGAGNISSSHVKGIQHNSDIVELAAICDVDREKAQKAADANGVSCVFDNYEEMLQQEAQDGGQPGSLMAVGR